MKTTKNPPIQPDATLLIQQSCGGCHGTGETADGAICVTCWGTRRVTLRVTLGELADALAQIQVSCDACHGQGIIRQGRWIEDKHTYEQRHVEVESDCAKCGGSGHVRQLAASGY